MAQPDGPQWFGTGNAQGTINNASSHLLTSENMQYMVGNHSHSFPNPPASTPHSQHVHDIAPSKDLSPHPQTKPTEERLRYEIGRLSDDTAYTQDQLWRAWSLVREGNIMATSLRLSNEDVKQGLTILRNMTVFTSFRQLLCSESTALHSIAAQAAAEQQPTLRRTSFQYSLPPHTASPHTIAQYEVPHHTNTQQLGSHTMLPLDVTTMDPDYDLGHATRDHELQTSQLSNPWSSNSSVGEIVDIERPSGFQGPRSQSHRAAEDIPTASSFMANPANDSFSSLENSPQDTATPMSTPAMSFTSRVSPYSNQATPSSTPATPWSTTTTPFSKFAVPLSVTSTPITHPRQLSRAGPIRSSSSSKPQKFSSKNQKNRQINYQCSYCDHYFASLPPLYSHEAEQHDARFSYKCCHSDCGNAQFDTVRGINKHHSSTHKDCLLADCIKFSRMIQRGYKQSCACGVCGKLIDLSDYKAGSSDWVTRANPAEANNRKQFLINKYHDHINGHRMTSDDEGPSARKAWMRDNWQRALIVEAFITDNQNLKEAWAAEGGTKSMLLVPWEKLASSAWNRLVEAFEFGIHSTPRVAKETVDLVSRYVRACNNDTQQQQRSGASQITEPACQEQFRSAAQHGPRANDVMEGILLASSHNRDDDETLNEQVGRMLSEACSSKASLRSHKQMGTVEVTDDTLPVAGNDAPRSETLISSDAFDDANGATTRPGAYLHDDSKRFASPSAWLITEDTNLSNALESNGSED